MRRKIIINGVEVELPIFCPDATKGVVRSVDSGDLARVGVKGVIVNTWHLAQILGVEKVKKLGGVKKLMNYQGLVISDSGGFQVFSLFQKRAGFGKITDEGLVTYRDSKKQHRLLFTPEDSIKMQFALGSDLMVCLDDFTPPEGSEARQKESVERTIAWARRCKSEFERRLGGVKKKRPLLFAVIQGHRSLALRRQCAGALLEIGFDGYGLGGWIFKEEGKLDLEVAEANARLTPDEFPLYDLGFGKLADIKNLYHLGYDIFDCVLPTRDGRHGRIYVLQGEEGDCLCLRQGKYALDERPLEAGCDCPVCQRYTRAYLHHLYKIGESAFYRLASLHNLRCYTRLCQRLGDD